MAKGKPATASDVEIIALLQKFPHAQMMGCRPVNFDDYPEPVRHTMRDTLADLDPGWIDMRCDLCDIEIRMGPRQRTHWELDKEHFMVLDLLCASYVASRLGETPETINAMSLGGR